MSAVLRPRRSAGRTLVTSVCLLGALLTVSAGSPAAHGSEASTREGPAPEAKNGYLTFYLDNDLFGGTDRNYTNGARFSWISEGRPLIRLPRTQAFLERMAKGEDRLFSRFSGFRAANLRDGSLEVNYGLSLTQLMFTPEDFLSTTQPVDQRRYAGWLGLGFSVHARDDQALNSAEFIIGTTGPRSLAEEAQDLVHEARDFDTFEGWDDQIPNEITVDFAFTQKRRIRILDRSDTGFSIDGFGEWGARLGTFRTRAFGGSFFRAGFNLPADFSDPRISATSYSHQIFDRRAFGASPLWSVYAIFGFQGSAVGFDATLDGPLFDDFDTGNDRTPFVGEVFAGFGARLGPLELSYAHTFRSKEFDEQDGGANFGSVAVRLRL